MDYVLLDSHGQRFAEGSFDGVLTAASWAAERGRILRVSDWRLQTRSGVMIAWPADGSNDGDYMLSDEGLVMWREQ